MIEWFTRARQAIARADSPPVPGLAPDQMAVMDCAANLMKVINESLQISNNSTNPETKVSRLEVARAKLDALVLLAAQHPFIKVEREAGVWRTIALLEKEYSEAGHYAQTDISCRDYRQDIWRGLDMPVADIIKGFCFCATLQLRTPLRVLLRHGELHEGLSDPPAIARQQWEGIWIPVTKNWRALGLSVDGFSPSTMSSDIGPIPADGGDYLKFLVAVRTIVESVAPIDDRRAALREELRRALWADYCRKLGGKQRIVDQFFPGFIDSVKGLPCTVIASMWEAGLTTPAKIAATPDKTLRAIKGLGPAKIAALRAACAAAGDQHAELIESVER